MDEIIFNSQEELYKRIFPALKSKRKMMMKNGFSFIKEIDIWNYMRFNKWNRSYGLELCDMVEDILHTDPNVIVMFYHSNKSDSRIDINDFSLPKLNLDKE